MAQILDTDTFNTGLTLVATNSVILLRGTYTNEVDNGTAFLFNFTGAGNRLILEDYGSAISTNGDAALVFDAGIDLTVNAGSSVRSDVDAILLQNAGTLGLANFGRITGAVTIQTDGSHSITNYGEISGSPVSGYAIFVTPTATSVRLDNFGLLTRTVSLGGNDDVVRNYATIIGQVDLWTGNDTLFNSGTMSDANPILNTGPGGNKTITNTGFIGTTVAGNDAITLLAGNDVVNNFGSIFGGIHLGGGTDTYQAHGGASINGTVFGEAGGDGLIGNDFADFLNGGADGDTLTGNGGNDSLNGGTGNDAMDGGAGNDTYFVDSQGDTLTDSSGNDTVRASTNYALASGVKIENLINAAGSGLTLTGNELAQTITGHLTAADTLYGGGGADTLNGQGGSDSLDGGAGNDAMNGGAGNDNYFVESQGDTLTDSGGVDSVHASVNYTLAAGVAIEKLNNVSGGGLTLTGNELAQTILGHLTANDTLSGGGGADILRGLGGNDTYALGAFTATIVDTAGTADLITSTISRTLVGLGSIENLTLLGTAFSGTGNALANLITGNASGNTIDGGLNADTLLGNAGNDTLIGGAGNDTLVGGAGDDLLMGGAGLDKLTGGAGNDLFVFDAPLSPANRDSIADFANTAGNNDTFRLDDDVMTQLGAAGALNANAFFAGAAAHDADDRIVYNKATGNLLYDANGNAAGGFTLLATLINRPTLTAGDFTVL